MAFADDLLIFLNGATHNLQSFGGFLEQYQSASRRVVNYRKSHFNPTSTVPRTQIHSMECSISLTSAHLPLKYLGVNLVKGRMKSSYFLQLISHFDACLNRWHNCMLSPAERLILIRHVLSAIPPHYIAATQLPLITIHAIHRRIYSFSGVLVNYILAIMRFME